MAGKYAHKEMHRGTGTGSLLRDIILGSQDGLVNVLGIILAVATAIVDVKIVIIAGLAATFAESISMAAVAYTSTKASRDFYRSELEREKWEMNHWPDREREEIRVIYKNKGFTGALLNAIVKRITSNKKMWLNVMMDEELHLTESHDNPVKSAAIVGFSAIGGSIVPLISFFFLPVREAIIASLILAIIVLFVTGYIKGKLTTKPLRSAVEMAIIGMAAAIVGYAIGAVLGVALYAT